jgi:hypothetical protein
MSFSILGPVRASAWAAALALSLPFATASATTILFVGNSFTYGEPAGGPPIVQNYKPSTVTDLNGSNIGGVPSLFKAFTLEAGLPNYVVSLETVPGVGLDYHYQNKLALINKPWDQVVLQSYSTLDGANPGNPAKLIQYAGLFGQLLKAQNPNVDIHLDATWSRADQTYLPSGHWYGQSIYAMGNDVKAGYDAAKAANPQIDDVIHVGSAWNRAFASGFADTNPYDGIQLGQVNMWAPDAYHASVFGYYLEALMFFGDITKLDPLSLGFDQVAMDLGINAAQALALQTFAHNELLAIPEPSTTLLLGMGVFGLFWMRRRRRVF